MSKGIAHGSADGPRMIYGRENVNWAGPKQAGTLDDVSDNPMDDSHQNSIKTDIEARIEDLQHTHTDDYAIQHYGELTNAFDVQQSLRRLHEMFPAAALDSDTSPLRAGKYDVMNTPDDMDIELRYANRGGLFYSNIKNKRKLNDILDGFSNMSYKLAGKESGKDRKKLLQLRNTAINDDFFGTLEQCVDHIDKPFRGNAKAEYAILDSFMKSAWRNTSEGRRERGSYSLDEARETIAKYKKMNDDMYAVNIPEHLDSQYSNIMNNVLTNIDNYSKDAQDKINELYMNLMNGMSIVAPLYGDDEKLDAKLDGVITKLYDQFENDFYHEMLVKDHIHAEDIAMQYGMDVEVDAWREGEHNIEGSFDMHRPLHTTLDDADIVNSTQKPNIQYFSEVAKDYQSPETENIRLDENIMGSDAISSYSNRVMSSHEDYLKAKKFSEDYKKRENGNRLMKLRNSDPVSISTVKESGSYSHTIMSEAFYDAKRKDTPEEWKKYDKFMQEVQQLEKIPSSGVKSSIQKTAVVQKLYNEIIKGEYQGISAQSLSPREQNYDQIAQQVYRDSMKDNITNDKLSDIDRLI